MPTFTGQSGRQWGFFSDRRLGRPSGFGEVFVGSDGTTEWAVKRVPLRIGSADEVRRREREVEMAMKFAAARTPLDHVLFPIDWGMFGDDLMLVMPKAERSLDEAISLRNLTRQQQLAALSDIATGMAELSSIDVLHRDLKPENVLWLGGRWRLSDFGIARDLDLSTASATFSGFGCLAYLAPEVWEHHPATRRSDLYAFGVLAYEVMGGGKPNGGAHRFKWRT